MSELFSSDWMQDYAVSWNVEPDLADALARIQFQSTIGYGFKKESQPRGVLVVENGQLISAGDYASQLLNWDLPAEPQDWQKWLTKGLDLAGLGPAYRSRKLVCEVGDYFSMIKDPRMVGPFIQSFAVMGQISRTEKTPV